MVIYDLCVAWNWPYDADFIRLLEASCQSSGLTLLQIQPGDLPQTLNSFVSGELGCRVFIDRASDADAQFLSLVQWAREDEILSINPYERASLTWDKAKMHSLLVEKGLEVPATIILPPYLEQPDLPEFDLCTLSAQFTIKPAHGSGGVGVMTNATSWEHVMTVRQEHATDNYLLQAHVTPADLDGRPAWFRVIYCAGRIFPCWWNPLTHIYTMVSEEDKNRNSLDRLEDISITIAEVCGLDLFSSEIALTPEGRYVVVDYVNDQIDLRLQSNAAEGVPDEVVKAIADRLARHIAAHL